MFNTLARPLFVLAIGGLSPLSVSFFLSFKYKALSKHVILRLSLSLSSNSHRAVTFRHLELSCSNTRCFSDNSTKCDKRHPSLLQWDPNLWISVGGYLFKTLGCDSSRRWKASRRREMNHRQATFLKERRYNGIARAGDDSCVKETCKRKRRKDTWKRSHKESSFQ